ncbi:tetratricopeptide repeat protein [Streptomyces sp. NPDC058891]|uniref:tetratricopeptide repeat protein n=1 Tax=Streptomyces sp. NPDC058891 TaxID=3346667 RepID=UPI0036B78128
MEFIQRNIGLFGRTAGGISRAQATVFRGLLDQLATGEYEEVEARAQALAARPRRVWDRSPEPVWMARTFALTAAVLYGRREHVLPELEALTVALRQTSGSVRTLLLVVRVNRAVVLLGQERYANAESEAAGVLREVTRLAHLTRVADIELSALACLAEALCGQGRFEEAEAVARGNLPRATGNRAASLRSLLVRSLNGQGRYEEALAESRQPTPPASRAGSGQSAMVVAAALHGLGRRDEAEMMARQAVDECEQFLHPTHPRIREARDLLAQITAGDPPPEAPDAGAGSS